MNKNIVINKSEEMLHAQVASFAETLSPEERSRLLKHLSETSLKLLWNNAQYDSEEGFDIFSEPASDDATTLDDYIAHLRSNANHSDIHAREKVLRYYDNFNEKFTVVGDTLEGSGIVRIGGGAYSNVYDIGDGFVARIAKDDNFRYGADTIDHHIAGATKIPADDKRFEHIVAASYTDRITIAEKLPGKSIDAMGQYEFESVSDEQLAELVDLIDAADAYGVYFDYNSANFLYDAHEGFKVLDYSGSEHAIDGRPELKTKGSEYIEMAYVLSKIGAGKAVGSWLEQKYSERNKQEIQAMLKHVFERNLSVVTRYLEIVLKKHTDDVSSEDVDIVEALINEHIERLATTELIGPSDMINYNH